MKVKFQPESTLQSIARDMSTTITSREHGTRETTPEQREPCTRSPMPPC